MELNKKNLSPGAQYHLGRPTPSHRAYAARYALAHMHTRTHAHTRMHTRTHTLGSSASPLRWPGGIASPIPMCPQCPCCVITAKRVIKGAGKPLSASPCLLQESGYVLINGVIGARCSRALAKQRVGRSASDMFASSGLPAEANAASTPASIFFRCLSCVGQTRRSPHTAEPALPLTRGQLLFPSHPLHGRQTARSAHELQAGKVL